MRALALLARGALFMSVVLTAAPALSQSSKDPPRSVKLEWDVEKNRLYATLAFRDVFDSEVRRRFSKGVPTVVVFTATLHAPGSDDPVATTAQSCRITWLVWDEYYRIEFTRPEESKEQKTLEVEGVLRRCAEVNKILVADRTQVSPGVALLLKVKVQVNPIGKEVIEKIKRWVSRPSGTATAGPSDALFSTFTGLFLQRVGAAERDVKFETVAVVPTVRKKSKPKPKPEGKG